MEVNKLPDFQKCGEILIDVKSKNKRNKTYMFHCTFCDMKFNELKKFSLHIGEEHFNDFDDIVAGIEVKTETEEIQAEAFAAVKKSDPKVDVEPKDSQVETFTVIERPDLNDYKTVEGDSTNLYPMHLVNAVDDHLNFEVKNELMDENEESIFCDAEVNAISESDKEATEEVSVYRTSADTSVLFDSDSDADKTPMKKIKLDLATQDKKAKKKTINNETNCDESKEGDCNISLPHLTYCSLELQPKSSFKEESIFHQGCCNLGLHIEERLQELNNAIQNLQEIVVNQYDLIMKELAEQKVLVEKALKKTNNLCTLFPIKSFQDLDELNNTITADNHELYVNVLKSLLNGRLPKTLTEVISESICMDVNLDGLMGKRRLKDFKAFFNVLKDACQSLGSNDVEKDIRIALRVIKKRCIHAKCINKYKM